MNSELRKKIVDLETSLGLLQHDFEQQNRMIVQTARQLQQMELTLRRLTDQMASLQADREARGLPADEKPPHY